MRRINILLAFFSVFTMAIAQDSMDSASEKENAVAFGAQFNEENTLSAEIMAEKYATMMASDTVQTQFSATVLEVCQAKGCWMKLQLAEGEETMVRFKDYGFFMPKDIAGKRVVVNGEAFVEFMSVADQKHYAEDGGASTEELAKITEPKKTLSFEADGVLLMQ